MGVWPTMVRRSARRRNVFLLYCLLALDDMMKGIILSGGFACLGN